MAKEESQHKMVDAGRREGDLIAYIFILSHEEESAVLLLSLALTAAI